MNVDDLKDVRSFLKKLKNKPMPVVALRMRTHSTASIVLEAIEGIPFEELSLNLYFYCKDREYSEFTRMYESQLELAGANPARFIDNLYKFYNRMASYLVKQHKLLDFFEFLGSCYESLFNLPEDCNGKKVIEQYVSLLLGQLEYLRPSKFDLTKMVVGATTDGLALTVRDPFPLIDLPAYELVALESRFTNDVFKRTYEKYGLHYDNFEAYHLDCVRNQIFTLNIGFMVPYINENTVDMLPQEPMTAYQDESEQFIPINRRLIDLVHLQNLLFKRKRMLSKGQGIDILFDSRCELKSVRLKEHVHNGAICLIFRMSSRQYGDTSGVYNPRTKRFLSFFGIGISVMGQAAKQVNEQVRAFILWLYASLVCSDPNVQISKLDDYFLLPNGRLGEATVVEIVPRESFTSCVGATGSGIRKNNPEKYEAILKGMGQYIRRLPQGQSASEEASALAAEMGYDLEDGYTFVQSFSKRVFRLRDRER